MRAVLSGTALIKKISRKSLRGQPATNAIVSQFGSVSRRIVIPIAPVDSAAFGAFRPEPALPSLVSGWLYGGIGPGGFWLMAALRAIALPFARRL